MEWIRSRQFTKPRQIYFLEWKPTREAVQGGHRTGSRRLIEQVRARPGGGESPGDAVA